MSIECTYTGSTRLRLQNLEPSIDNVSLYQYIDSFFENEEKVISAFTTDGSWLRGSLSFVV
jgi:hypothetical protein